MFRRLERPKGLVAGLLILALTSAGTALALPDDRNQPILIEADEALRDEKQGFTLYQGNDRILVIE